MKKFIKALFGKRGEESQTEVQPKARKSKAVGVLMAMVALVAALPTAVGAAPIDFSTQTGVGVTTADVIGTGFSFAGMFDEYTMLVLGVIVAPVTIGFVIWLIRKLPKFGGGSKA